MKKKTIVILLVVVMLVAAFASVASAASRGTGLYKEDGKWKYYENGTFKEVTGLVQKPNGGTWHYVENGIYKRVTGLVKCVQPGSSKGKWYYVVKGDLDTTATGLVKCIQPGSSNGKWYYVEAGKLNKTAAGLVKCIQPGKSDGKWYYVEEGRLKEKAEGLVKCIQPGTTSTGKWYYVEGGKLNKYTGVVKCIQPGDSQGKWYYVNSGKLDKSFTGLANNKAGDWCYISEGSWKRKTLLYHGNDGTYYYIQDGTIDYPRDGSLSVLGTNTGVLVSIEKQHLWFYKDGALILSSPIVSGARNVSDTPKGTFYIYSKRRDTRLRGPTWDVFVNYWLGIDTYGAYGLHDASWRDSYGGSIYTYDGSHGCVNLPVEAVRVLYGNIDMYTKVRIY